MRRVRINDVADKANVSISTVSQFLNKRYQFMSIDTKNRIEMAIKELGYHPNEVARSLKQKRTNTIGIVLANILHTFSTYVSRGVEDYCHQQGYNVIICNADNNPQKEKEYIEILKMKQLDGIILMGTGKNNEFINKDILKYMPIIQIDRYFDYLASDIVQADNFHGSLEMVEHIIKQGFDRIALVVPSGDLISVRKQRIEGYYEALRKHHIPFNQKFVRFISSDTAPEHLDELMALEKPPNAIFAINDLTGVEVLNYMKKRDVEIPKDMAVAVFDDLPLGNLIDPPLTVVSQPAYEMGKLSAELLIGRIEKKISGNFYNKIMPCSLIIRKSCNE